MYGAGLQENRLAMRFEVLSSVLVDRKEAACGHSCGRV